MSNRRKARHARRPLADSGKSLLMIGQGFYHLPASLADLEEWRRAAVAAAPGPAEAACMSALADMMADAIITGNSAYDDADIDHLVIIHWPDGTATVQHAASMAVEAGTTVAEVWDGIDGLVKAGALVRCKSGDDPGSCGDGGYRAVMPGEATS